MTRMTAIVCAAFLLSPVALAENCNKSKAQLTSYPDKASTMQKADIVDTATAAGSFGTLLAAAQAAGLVDALKSEGPLTVFAPTDAAFAALPAGTVETLLKPENKDMLAGILKLHVISGKVKAKDLAGKTTVAETLNGFLTVDGTDGVSVAAPGSTATVVTADVKASNGIIHVIDTVLLPHS